MELDKPAKTPTLPRQFPARMMGNEKSCLAVEIAREVRRRNSKERPISPSDVDATGGSSMVWVGKEGRREWRAVRREVEVRR